MPLPWVCTCAIQKPWFSKTICSDNLSRKVLRKHTLVMSLQGSGNHVKLPYIQHVLYFCTWHIFRKKTLWCGNVIARPIWYSSVSIVTRLPAREFDSRQGENFFILHQVQTRSEATLFPTQCLPGADSLSGNETDCSPPCGADAKECVELHLQSPIHVHVMVFNPLQMKLI
jgi:hypothetical protein